MTRGQRETLATMVRGYQLVIDKQASKCYVNSPDKPKVNLLTFQALRDKGWIQFTTSSPALAIYDASDAGYEAFNAEEGS